MYARECRRETDTVCACQLHGMVKGKRKKVPRSIWRSLEQGERKESMARDSFERRGQGSKGIEGNKY